MNQHRLRLFEINTANMECLSTGENARCDDCADDRGISNECECQEERIALMEKAMEDPGSKYDPYLEFSREECDTCETSVPGSRWPAHYTDSRPGSLEHIYVCEDCLRLIEGL